MLQQFDIHIKSLIDIISNTTEAFSTVLFLADGVEDVLTLRAYQSLSQNIDENVRISPGDGLIGWVHKNRKPVNIDQFERDTRRLLFYRTDEAIKSFMAVPLPGSKGVLAVDSKQRYVFTDKNHKILHQFGQALGQALERLEKADGGRRAGSGHDFLITLEGILNRGKRPSTTFNQSLNLIRTYSEASACFLTLVSPGDPTRYYILDHDSDQPLKLPQESLSQDKGLAGWVMQKKQTLVLEKARLDSERSYLFFPDEPIKNLQVFAGFPSLWAGKLRGALILAGVGALGQDETRLKSLEAAANRLAAGLEMELLYERVAELSRLDPQVGLPHRTFFTQRLAALLKRASARGTNVTLIVIQVANLGRAAVLAGQPAAREALKAAARKLLSVTASENELGHLSYGIMGLALTAGTENEAKRVIELLPAQLAALPLEANHSGIRLDIEAREVHFPSEAKSAEELIQLGLDRLIK
ncbi:MAG: GAF domain-containing protein [Pseudomonadota bacterium]